MASKHIDSVAIRAFTSLTRRDVEAVQAAVRAVALGHVVHEHVDYDGYLSLLIAQDRPDAPTIIVSGTTRSVIVSVLWADDMTEIGTFPSIGAATLVLRSTLERTNTAMKPVAAAALFRHRHGDDAPLLAALDADAAPDARYWPAVLRDLDRHESQS